MMPPSRHPLVLVAAVARNGVIGAAGGLPWRLPGDLAHFRAITMGHPLLMGRATFESIGRPLPGRLTTVLSRRRGFHPAGVTIADNLDAALASAERQAEALGAANIMVAGGASLYAVTIGLAQTLLLTEVAADPDGDTLFPAIDRACWDLTERRNPTQRQDDDHAYTFARWDRVRPL